MLSSMDFPLHALLIDRNASSCKDPTLDENKLLFLNPAINRLIIFASVNMRACDDDKLPAFRLALSDYVNEKADRGACKQLDEQRVRKQPDELLSQVLYLYVDSILRTGAGVADNLTSGKSNSELVRSLESLLESTLACPKHPSIPLPPFSSSASSSVSSFEGVNLTKPDRLFENCEAEPSYSHYGSSKDSKSYQVVTIPNREALHQEPIVRFSETREALDVTAKFFYLPGMGPEDKEVDLDPAWIQESLEQLQIATGLEDIDTFIISFPGLVFDQSLSQNGTDEGFGDKYEAEGYLRDGLASQQQILSAWKAASGNKHLKSLGVSEFSLERLQWLLGHGGEGKTTGVTSKSFRKPRISQINTRNCCNVPNDLISYAKHQDMDLWVHSDCTGVYLILPQHFAFSAYVFPKSRFPTSCHLYSFISPVRYKTASSFSVALIL